MKFLSLIATLVLLVGAAACSTTPSPERRSERAASEEGASTPGPVVDSAGIFDPEEEDVLRARLVALERETTAQIAVVTTPTLAGAPVEAYAFQLFGELGLGRREVNNGLLIVIAPNDRKVRVEVGLGLEWQIRDADAAAAIDAMTGDFRSGAYAAGVAKGLDLLEPAVRSVSWSMEHEDLASLKRRGEQAHGRVVRLSGVLTTIDETRGVLETDGDRIVLRFAPHWFGAPGQIRSGRATLTGRVVATSPLELQVLAL